MQRKLQGLLDGRSAELPKLVQGSAFVQGLATSDSEHRQARTDVVDQSSGTPRKAMRGLKRTAPVDRFSLDFVGCHSACHSIGHPNCKCRVSVALVRQWHTVQQ